MFRTVLWLLVAAFLLIVGMWPAAAAPIGLVGAGAAIVVGKIPGVVLLGASVIAWLKHRPATPVRAA